MTVVIDTQGLTRRFGSNVAVDAVDLTIGPGEVYGFLGRNGAGKTTLIRMLLGLIRPTSGGVSILGRPIDTHAGTHSPWSRVGYLVESPGLYPELTVMDHLELAASYRRLTSSALTSVIERMNLGHDADVAARHLSLGNRQRLGLALALAHSPDLLILDEPTNSLDPAGVVEIRTLLRELADTGVTVFMSSHIVTEVARLADHVGIIDNGRLIEELTADHLAALGRPMLRVTLPDADQVPTAMAAFESASIVAECRARTITSTDPTAIAHPEEIATILVRAGTPPQSLAVEAEDLERHFLELTAGGP